jgi:hypothetical protein
MDILRAPVTHSTNPERQILRADGPDDGPQDDVG